MAKFVKIFLMSLGFLITGCASHSSAIEYKSQAQLSAEADEAHTKAMSTYAAAQANTTKANAEAASAAASESAVAATLAAAMSAATQDASDPEPKP